MHRQLKPSTMLNPVPAVMVSCKGTGAQDKPNIITLAWAGTVCSEPPMVSISVRKSRYSHALITQSGEFSVNLVNQSLAKACDFCGVKSGRDTDKYSQCELDTIAVAGLQYAPGIAQSPVILGCKVKSVTELGSHDMIVGEVVSVMADESLFDNTDRLCLDKADLIAYNHGEYFALGKKLGFFGWSIASKKALDRRGIRQDGGSSYRGKASIAPANRTCSDGRDGQSRPQDIRYSEDKPRLSKAGKSDGALAADARSFSAGRPHKAGKGRANLSNSKKAKRR